jgi:hypothetical protein
VLKVIAGNNWREHLKASPLRGLYGAVRRAKRVIRNEPLAGILPYDPPPLDAATLRAMAAAMAGHPALYYSLALAYLSDHGEGSPSLALACLRCAEALNYDSPERIALYKGVALGALGQDREAMRMVEPLVTYELTPEENGLRREILAGRVPHGYASCGTKTPSSPPPPHVQGSGISGRVLVLHDTHGSSALWFQDATFFLADPMVTGLSIGNVCQTGLEFDYCVGPAAILERARRAHISVACWVPLSMADMLVS